ncbi:geranylgeranylglyceryl/heptaprenylglyceryl phosphate synthase [Seonamhaeicola marinus]|uniref:Geranylgeranylglyceryl phosphate synthase n=1 Tax=Seonamhaeicola marinus TaxID=1912246 RepID=A0A5D0HGN8_9FLAO|nr:geranylgeranylglyceryl/heptaprenylglyceryl phosphate synthase [Seonamhaeicola marinus]TYA70100.1 geranylgeranylglyceryl/heptaprenylglyceryl phosphate synthase [Seonamhaeicola marinus]
MNSIYKHIKASVSNRKRLLAVLIDPDKMAVNHVASFIFKLNASKATHIFVGGSTVNGSITEDIVKEIKEHTQLPVVLFPGDTNQITNKADGILFLSLISGRNSEYLIGKHVKAVSELRGTELEVIPTGYLLINGGNETAVERVTETKPLDQSNVQCIVDTAKAGELLGKQLIYLEAGSGAKEHVALDVINQVKKELNVPLIVGGGIRTKLQLENVYESGADLVVIGTAFEEDESFFEDLKK